MSDPPPLSRRHFLAGSAASGIAGSALATQSTDASPQLPAARPTFISTWRFGAPANELASKTYQEQGSMLDAIEKGIGLVEAEGQGNIYDAGLLRVHRVEDAVLQGRAVIWARGGPESVGPHEPMHHEPGVDTVSGPVHSDIP